ncbi:hypothetical protein AtNW77_Chr5g0143931 [Arabidopsis thaliana]
MKNWNTNRSWIGICLDGTWSSVRARDSWHFSLCTCFFVFLPSLCLSYFHAHSLSLFIDFFFLYKTHFAFS